MLNPPARPHHRSIVTAILSVCLASAVVCGCGGGGGGRSSTGTGTGNTIGDLPPNVLLYVNTPDFGVTNKLNQINSDGTGGKLVASLPSGYQGVSLNPAVKGQLVFGYSPSAGTPLLYGIYKNSSISGAGATQVIAPAYSFIGSIQVSFDGVWIYYLAAVGTGSLELYKVSINGGAPIVLDSDEVFTANVDISKGSKITYDKLVSYPNGNVFSAIFVRSTANSATPVQITNDSSANYCCPQFSKDGTKVVCLSDKADSAMEVYSMNATDGSTLTQITNAPSINKQYTAVSFSADGTTTAFVADSIGVYVSGPIGTNNAPTQIVNDTTTENSLYWTSLSGRSSSGTTGYISKQRHRGLRP